ncbi:MAG: hypothetical protein L6Q77_04475 [Bacteroidetes bacterium]|nr:hypothetical protein [Bacteroidota bacterium]
MKKKLNLFSGLVFSLVIVLPHLLTAQSKEKQMGLTKDKPVSMILFTGMGYTFYNMKSETNLISKLSDTGKLADLEKPGGGISTKIGLGVLVRDPFLRVYSDIRWDNYGNSGIKIPLLFIDILGDIFGRNEYDFNHDIMTIGIHADKLWWHDDASRDLYYGIGGNYSWVLDEREETVYLRKNGDDFELNEKTDISATIAGVQAIIGRFYPNGVTFTEFTLGYQFDLGHSIEKSKKPGRSTESLDPAYQSIKLSVHIGLAL